MKKHPNFLSHECSWPKNIIIGTAAHPLHEFPILTPEFSQIFYPIRTSSGNSWLGICETLWWASSIISNIKWRFNLSITIYFQKYIQGKIKLHERIKNIILSYFSDRTKFRENAPWRITDLQCSGIFNLASFPSFYKFYIGSERKYVCYTPLLSLNNRLTPKGSEQGCYPRRKMIIFSLHLDKNDNGNFLPTFILIIGIHYCTYF